MAVRDVVMAAAGASAEQALNIEYVGGTTLAITGSTATNTDVSLTSLTGGLASSPSAGDLVIVYYGVSSGGSRSIGVTTSGYTEVAELTVADTYDANLSVSYKVMGTTPDTLVVVSATGAGGDAGAVAVQVWRNVDPYLPMDVTRTTATAGNSVLCNPPAITPITPGAVIIAGGAGAHTAGVQTFGGAGLSNFISIGGPNTTNDVTVGMGSFAWTSGAYDPAAFTFSSTSAASNSWAAVTLALRPPQSQPGPILIAQASAQTASNATSFVINKPTGTLEGDLMVAVMNAGGITTWTGDTGWTEVADQNAQPSTRIAYKVAGASEPASYTFGADTSRILSGTIATYRNAAYDAVGAIVTGTDPLVLSAVTASSDYSRIIATVSRATAGVTITGPASMEAVFTDSDTAQPSRIVEQDISLSPAGSSGTRSFTTGGTTNVGGALVALKPAASYTKYAQYIASNSNFAPAATSVPVSTPASVPGNLLLFVVCPVTNGTDITISTPSGWTLLSGNSTGTSLPQPGMYVFYRVADGSEAVSYSATSSNTSLLLAAIITLAGVDEKTLTAGATNIGSSTTSITANSVTATNNGILLYLGIQATDGGIVSIFTPPSGMTEAVELGANAALEATLEVAYQEGLSAGSTGDKTATASVAAGINRYRAILVHVGAK